MSNTNAYGRKGHDRKRPYTNACGKERKNRPQMPVAKKEKPNHKCWRQMKNGCPNQSCKQLTSNKRNKTAETISKPQTVPTCKRKVEKNDNTHKKTPPNHNRLLSATKEWMTTVIRAQSKNNCANNKQMESQTNHN